MRKAMLFVLPLLAVPLQASAQKAGPALSAAVAAPSRSPANVARDAYRHPGETLAFFAVKPTDNVVEIWPGGGWYTEILAPYLAAKGNLTVAAPAGRASDGIAKKLDANAAVYGKVARANFPTAGVLLSRGDRLTWS